ncbi:MAG TPA: hypothetical protein VIC85_00695 [Ktedonobacterales bacterium]|jgi:hypothetical protein
MTLKRMHVDFNTITSTPVGLVKYLDDDGQLLLAENERVVLVDADGLEVEATIVPYMTARGARVCLAAPDENTWCDTISPAIPLPPVEAREVE